MNANALTRSVVAIAIIAVSCVPAPPPVDPPEPAEPVTMLHIEGEDGEYVFGGQSRTWTDEDGDFTVNGNGGRLLLAFDSDDHYFDFSFEAAALPRPHNHFAVGTYENAVRSPHNQLYTHGLSVTGNHRGCNTSLGSFEILQIEFNVVGEVERLAIEFDQLCDSNPNLLSGSIYINALPPFDGTNDDDDDGIINGWDNCPAVANSAQDDVDFDQVGDACDNTTETTFVHFNADPRDAIAGGLVARWTPENSDITVTNEALAAKITFTNGTDLWHMFFEANSGWLVAGRTYEGATRWPFHQFDLSPGMDIFGAGSGCNTVNGEFTVNEFERIDGEIVKLDIDFEHHCRDLVQGLFGTVRFDATA